MLGTVRSAKSRRLRGRRTLTNVVIGDGTGKLTLTFFNQQWRERSNSPREWKCSCTASFEALPRGAPDDLSGG